jgi:RNA polymerase sigma factor for flagellar operon FliA
MNYVEVAAIEDAGVQEVVSMETSSATYVAEGLIAHNCTRRMRGAMLDYLRSQDWVTRSARAKVKALRAAGQDRGLSETELARATGMDIAEVRSALAAVAARPVSMDAEPHDVAAEDDVEGQAVVSQVLGVMSGVIRRFGHHARMILILAYYEGMTVADLAPYVGVTPDEAVKLHQLAILEIHAEMLKVVA